MVMHYIVARGGEIPTKPPVATMPETDSPVESAVGESVSEAAETQAESKRREAEEAMASLEIRRKEEIQSTEQAEIEEREIDALKAQAEAWCRLDGSLEGLQKIRELAKAGEFKQAMEAAHEIEEYAIKADALREIIAAAQAKIPPTP
tara:strand:- start:111 stop:554 length:444 start_codon:yes stop_codon:yes gene_type:complete